MRPILFFLIAILGVLSCAEPQKPSTRHDKMAQAYCECTARIAEINREAAEISNDTSRRAEMMALFQSLQSAYQESKVCAGTVVAQYGKLKPSEFSEIEKILLEKCPDLVQQPELLREMLGE